MAREKTKMIRSGLDPIKINQNCCVFNRHVIDDTSHINLAGTNEGDMIYWDATNNVWNVTGDISINVTLGVVTFNSAYSFPSADGSANEALITNGAGTLSFGAPTPAPHALDSSTLHTTPTDITQWNATISAHGLCPKGNNDAGYFLNGTINWTAIPTIAAGTIDYSILAWDQTTDQAWEEQTWIEAQASDRWWKVWSEVASGGPLTHGGSYTYISHDGSYGYVNTQSGYGGALYLQSTAHADVTCFADAAEGDQPALNVCGYPSGDARRTAAHKISAANAYSITGVSKYGIGVASPVAALDSVGTIHIGQDTDLQTAAITHHTNNYMYVRGGTSGLALSNHNSTDVINISGAGHYISFETNSGERMRVTSTGAVGIATTTPAAKLDVLATTEQLRLCYDASNYCSVTVGSNGATTIATVDNAAALGHLILSPDGLVKPHNAYALPNIDGTATYLVKTDGAGQWGYVDPATIGKSYTAGDGLTLTGTDFSANVKNSIEIDTDYLQLVNDEASPAEKHVYASMGGARGWSEIVGDSQCMLIQNQADDIQVVHGLDTTAYLTVYVSASSGGATDKALKLTQLGHAYEYDGTTFPGSPDEGTDPDDLGNQIFRYNEDGHYEDTGLTDPCEDGDPCKGWDDQFGALDITEATNPPTQREATYNSLDTVEFDGTEYLTAGSKILGSGAITVYGILDSDTSLGLFLDEANGATAANGLGMLSGTGETAFVGDKGTFGTHNFLILTGAGSSLTVVAFVWDGTTAANAVKIYVNGTLTAQTTALVAAMAGTYNTRMGGYANGSAGNEADGHMLEVIGYSAAHSGTVVGQVTAFLRNKWAI